MAKSFRLGAKLHYPITIRRILKRPGEPVSKQDTILEYSFEWEKVTGDDMRQIKETHKQVTTVTWVSPADGVLKDIYLKQGQIIRGDSTCVLIEETCGHEIQFQGMCAVCGKDMTEVNWATEERDTDRAPINMTHDHTSLTVSEAAAKKLATEQQTALLQQRKLSLVVDLDQTIIHACIEPTVGEWQRDPKNPNYEAVKDVRSFQLNDEGPRGLATGCFYYIKLRPGLQEFLERISEMYELHVYTMGTRAYAQNIAKLVDPDQKLFGNRVISRDESGSMTAKSLERLFPTSTGMVAIIDDRADVWPKNRDNLIKVVPYDFFKGIGDINSSFLPKRQDIAPAPPKSTNGPGIGLAQAGKTTEGEVKKDGTATPAVSALEELVTMSGGDDTIIRLKQAQEQAHLLEKQLTERPLLHLQEQLDKEDESINSTQTSVAAAAATEESSSSSSSEETSTAQPETTASSSQPQNQQHRHNLLRDDDRELFYLTEHLTNLHHAFYDEYDHKCSSRGLQTHRPKSHHRPLGPAKEKKPDNGVDLAMVPDVGRVLTNLRRKVLSGCTIVLSGLVPLDIDVHRSELGLQVKSFGASIHTRVTNRTTHLVISTSRPRTQKVRQAARIPRIKIVNQNWLVDSMSQWKKLEPGEYSVQVHPADRIRPLKVPGQTDPTSTNNSQPEGETRKPPGKLILRIQNSQGQEVILEDDDNLPQDNADEDEGFDSDDEGTSSHLEDYGEEEEELEDLATYMPTEIMDGESSPIDNMKGFDWGEADQELEDFLASDSEDGDGDETTMEETGEDQEMKDADVDGETTGEVTAPAVVPASTRSGSDIKTTHNSRRQNQLSIANGSGAVRKISLGMKRKIDIGTGDEESESDSSISPGSVLAKRQKISAAASAKWAGSRLKNGGSASPDLAAATNGGGSGDGSVLPPTTMPTTTTTVGDQMNGMENDNTGDDDLEEADLLAMLEAEDSEKG